VSVTSTSTLARVGGFARRWRPRRPGRRLLAGLAVGLAAIGVAVAVTNPFAGGGSSGSSSANGSATSLARVTRQSLTSQTPVDGTLGYAGSSSIVVPAGTAQDALRQAEQTAAAARAALRTAAAGLSADQQTLTQARAKLAADRRKLASDCAGAGAAGSSSSGSDSGSGGNASPCGTAAQAVASDETSVRSAEQKVATDDGSVEGARVTLAGAEQSLAAAESSATGHEAAAAYTMLPSAGTVVRRGKALYAVDGQPVLLLYGRLTAWRAFRSGMPPGRDVAELNANLLALGYGSGLAGDAFTSATAQAIVRLQAAHGLSQTGVLQLGSVVFKPGPVRVTSITPSVGQTVQAGPVLTVSSTRHEVAIKLDAAQQAEVKVGDPVTITLPDNSTTPGRVSSVGKVASSSSSGSDSGSSTTTIDVKVRLSHQAAAGQLVQAPVSVSITTASVKDALVVPVNALLALAGGGYAIEVVDTTGIHHLVPVTPGLFDDGQGLVQVSGTGVKAGQRVVVPAS
jgi:Putative peptidoglycan binding domain/HlyD family secretion protein